MSEQVDFDAEIFGEKRREIWAAWLRALANTIEHTSDVDRYLQDYRTEDIEPEALLMCYTLAQQLDPLPGGPRDDG